jgi:hypothetical protein
MRNGTHFFGGWNHQTIRVEGRISTIEMTVKIAAPRWLFIGSLLPKIVRRLDEITFEIGTPQKKTLVCDPRIDDWWARHLDRFGHIKILKKLGYYCICYYGVYQSLPWCMVVFATAMCDNSQFFLFLHSCAPQISMRWFFFPLPCLISEYHQFKRSDFFRLNSCFRPVIKPGVWQNGRGICQL